MSNLTLFKDGSALPDYLRTNQLSDLTKSLMGGSGYKRISIKGSVFRMMMGGKEVAKNEDRAMNIVIVRAAEKNARTYYEGTWQEDVKSAPVCWSDGGEVPAPEATKPQSDKCMTCKQNIAGSGQGDSKACRWSRRLAVLLEHDMDGDIYGLSVPAASLFGNDKEKMGLQQYARLLGGHGIEVNGVVTEIRFDTDATAAKLQFRAVRPLTPAEHKKTLERRNEQAAIDVCTMQVIDIDGGPTETKEETPAEEKAPAPATESPFKVESAKATPTPKATPKPKAEVPEPTVRATEKPAAPSGLNVNAILEGWADD